MKEPGSVVARFHAEVGVVGAIVTAVGLLAGVAGAEEPRCSCRHETAVCVPRTAAAKDAAVVAASTGGAAGAKGGGVCVYLVNAFNRELRFLQQRDIDEEGLVQMVLGKKDHEDGTRKNARFFQTAFGRIEDERVSTDGVLVLRAYDGGKPVGFDEVGKIDLKIGDTTYVPEPAGGNGLTRTLFLGEPLKEAQLGDRLEVQVLADDSPRGKRYSWYRPRNGWVMDYTIAGLAFSWADWKFQGSPETSIVPAMVACNYRHFARNGRFYVFGGFAVGPNLVIERASKAGEDKSGSDLVNGIVGAAQVNLNGFQLGFGTRWAWSEGRLDPMITLSLTEALARGLGITDPLPRHIIGEN
jgi:hypothetical protein